MKIFGKQITNIPTGAYKVMLLVAAVVWGLGFVVMKDALAVVPVAQLLGIRFFLTGVVLFLLFFGKVRKAFDRKHILYGGLLGVLMFAAFWLQASGLADTMPGKNAFLTATYVVFVPFICWLVIRKKPSVYHVLAALICIAGVGLVSLQSSLSIESGDAITLVGSVLFAAHIVFVARWAKGRDILVLTVYQFLFAGVCGLVCGTLFETWPPVSVFLEAEFLLDIAYLVLFASCLALVFQNVALAHVPPAQVSLFLSLEAVFGVLFSALIYNEALTLKLMAGFGLIFLAILVSELFPLKRPLFKKKEPAAHSIPEHAKDITSPGATVASTEMPLQPNGGSGSLPVIQAEVIPKGAR